MHIIFSTACVRHERTDASAGTIISPRCDEHKGDVRRVCARLRSAGTRRELTTILYREVSGYSLFDLQEMRARVERDLRSVPAGYRRRLYRA